MRFLFARAIVMACSCLASLQAFAAADAPITLSEALQRALARRPELAGFAFELQAQDAQARLAAQRPATEVDLLVEDAGGSGERQGFDSAQTTLSLSRIIELGGKRDGRSGVAQATQARLRSEQSARQLDVVAEVARRFTEMLAQQARVAASRDALVLTERVRDAVERRVRAAAAPEAERERAQVAVAEASLALEDAEHVLRSARHALAAAMGLQRADFAEVRGDLYAMPASRSFDDLVAALRQTPDFLRFADEARVRDAELRLAEQQRWADLRATVGVRRYEAGDDTAFVAGVAMPLFGGRRAAPQIDATRADRARVDTDREAAFLRAQQQLHAQYEELEHARHVAGVLHQDVLPRLQRALELTEYAYTRGRYSYLEWSDAQRRLLDARMRLIDTAADFHTYRIDIERLTGESLVAVGDQP